MAKLILVFAVVIFGIHIPATAFGWYYALSWLDIPMHILGGAWLGLIFYYIFRIRKPELGAKNNWSFFVFGLGFVMLVGVVWEFYEFFFDVFIFKKYPLMASPPDVHFDTMLDLLDDIIGAAVGLGITTVLFKKKNDNDSLV